MVSWPPTNWYEEAGIGLTIERKRGCRAAAARLSNRARCAVPPWDELIEREGATRIGYPSRTVLCVSCDAFPATRRWSPSRVEDRGGAPLARVRTAGAASAAERRNQKRGGSPRSWHQPRLDIRAFETGLGATNPRCARAYTQDRVCASIAEGCATRIARTLRNHYQYRPDRPRVAVLLFLLSPRLRIRISFPRSLL